MRLADWEKPVGRGRLQIDTCHKSHHDIDDNIDDHDTDDDDADNDAFDN